MRSKDTIWSIKNVSKIDFSKPLSLADTSLFERGKNNDSCHLWTGISFAVKGVICFDYKWPKTFFIIKTRMRRYVLVSIDSQRVSTNPASQCSGIINWYLPSDGSLNFNGINLEIIRNKSGVKRYFNTSPTLEYVWRGKKNMPGTSYFDCQGRKIRRSPGQLWRGNQILIKVKDPGQRPGH
jgi:hypothetical protein